MSSEILPPGLRGLDPLDRRDVPHSACSGSQESRPGCQARASVPRPFRDAIVSPFLRPRAEVQSHQRGRTSLTELNLNDAPTPKNVNFSDQNSVEFTKNLNGTEVEFTSLPSRSVVVNK